jgi:HTH-type transcriptional regulator, glycine betaine synthesis regulator
VWVRGRGDRRKFYEAETDFWQIISNVLSGREMRDVERALNIMRENADRLSKAIPNMSESDQELSRLYLERIDQMQSLFKFAQLMITSILGKAVDLDVKQVSRIDIE